MRLGAHYLFSPGLVPSVMFVLGLPVLIALGFWQLDRAGQKSRLAEDFATMAEAPPVVVDADWTGKPPRQYRRVAATGEYLAERSLLNDNRTHQGQAGFHVLTPLRLEGAGAAVLVNRGWVRAGATRAVLPEFETPRGRVVVEGMVYAPGEGQLVLGPEEDHGGRWPRIIQRIDFTELENQLGVKLLPYTIRLSEQAPVGFVRDWRPLHGAGPDKHRAYAIQWFSFALIFLVVYLAHGLKRDVPGSASPEPGGRPQ